VKGYATPTTLLLLGLLLGGFTTEAFANDMTASLNPITGAGTVTYVAVKNVTFEYDSNGSFAQELAGKDERLAFTKSGDDFSLRQLANMMNEYFADVKESNARVSDPIVTYTGVLRGSDTSALLSLKVEIQASLSGATGSNPGEADVGWRDVVLWGPVIIDTNQYGAVDINSALGLIDVVSPELSAAFASSEAGNLLRSPVIDFISFSIRTLNGRAVQNKDMALFPRKVNGKYMMISISDTGMGIDKKDMAHIFDPFYTTKEKGKGTGLGLSMVYGIIKQHDGFINVYSEKSIGTTFKIYIPVTADMEDIRKEIVEHKPEQDFRGNETILIAEDEESVREFLKDILDAYGYKTIIAVDGEDAKIGRAHV